MSEKTVALFGEAERGVFQKAYICHSLPQLIDYLGQPPPHSNGLAMAIQALLYNQTLLFFRVEEEGFSLQDYYRGFHYLQENKTAYDLAAIGIPGVGDNELLQASQEICTLYHSVLMLTERDLYDYLTSQRL